MHKNSYKLLYNLKKLLYGNLVSATHLESLRMTSPELRSIGAPEEVEGDVDHQIR